MARKAEPGISYYPVKVNHTQNSKIKLLFNEFGPDGYWIWKCLLDRIYEDKGYYMDVADKDELELFAVDVCKKQVALVNEVIAGCVRRGLFDKAVFDMFNVLTSDRIQSNYLEATLARRKKDSVIELKADYLVIEVDENWKNVVIQGKKDILPGSNPIPPGRNPQSRVEYSNSKEEEKGAVFKNPFSDFFLPEWDAWKKYKRDQFKFSYKSVETEQAAVDNLFQISSGNEKTAKEIIKQSIANGWKGFFELKISQNGNQKNGSGSSNSKTAGGDQILARLKNFAGLNPGGESSTGS